MSDLPPTMRAWVYREKGHPSKVVKLETDFKTPQPADLGADEVLVEVHYTGFNAVITILIQSLNPRPFSFFLPRRDRVAVTELEFAGRLIAAGGNVLASRPDLKIGELVIGFVDASKAIFTGAGGLAEYAVAPAKTVVPYHVPGEEQPKLSIEEWAGLGGVGCTAIQVIDRAGVKSGDKVLINGGSGGAGAMMVQVTRSVVGPNGRVVATCSGANVELVKSLGADEVIDYRQCAPLHAYLAASEHARTPFDAIIDCVGIQDLFTHSTAYLAPGKTFLNIGGMDIEYSMKGILKGVWTQLWNRFCPRIFGGVPRWYRFYSATPDVESLERLRKLVQNEEVRQVVDSIWGFEDVPKAYEVMQSKRAKGKIIVRVRN
ncbi:alcohol dehydrogenase [Talaromyces proteolyticus]|uniref:Alcohol dehydrogenase n=1 Tax=Talaromyces proteolyticus TaxID=1131652 RepID=A0AAD4PTN0_9EURO|nr:alcohol dehydrogenase [Talaromyces proteolyticus]KAH8691130.1 alcohol dehydrogenase [Talaromyces proteolyticus]